MQGENIGKRIVQVAPIRREGKAMSEVLLEKLADGIAVVRLNRPEVRNALNLAVRELLRTFL